ncbi:MAG: hypothetical protein PVG35_07685 [Desulfobacterales bacterium]|jgi:hypothetical protein
MKLHTLLPANALILLTAVLWAAQVNAAAAQDSPIDYPEPVLQAVGLAPATITRYRTKFIKDPVHREWMQYVRSLLPDLDVQTEKTVARIHTSFLYMKDALDVAYRKDQLNRDTFEKQVGHLLNWFQEVHSSILNPAQYQALFAEPAAEKTDETDSADEPLGFPVENLATSIEMIEEKIDARTIEALKGFHQQRKQELAVIVKAHEEGSLPTQEFEKIKNELNSAYISNCRNILTDEQFRLLFGGNTN